MIPREIQFRILLFLGNSIKIKVEINVSADAIIYGLIYTENNIKKRLIADRNTAILPELNFFANL